LADNGEFVVQGVKVLFPGFLILYPQGEVDKVLPPFKEGEVLKLIAFHPTQKFTEPPPRYNEASLIKSLEEKGIGRPSTYAPIISTIGERQYVEKIEKKFQPTVLGFAVSDFLVANFPEVVDIPFTAKMEDSLDSIARGEAKWVPVIREFWDPFSVLLAKVYKEAQRVKIAVEETDKKCPSCGSSLVIRLGKYGKFLACSQFPKCHYTERYIDKTGLTCPKCKGEIIIKRTKRGKQFYGCSNYPKCDFAAWKKEQILVHAQGQTLNS
jgi:DNA topoisomerase-1